MRTGFSSSGFAPLPYELMDRHRDPYLLSVYAWLHRHGWGSDEGCWASISTLVAETGIGHNKIRDALRTLRAEGWIETLERPGYTSIHRVYIDRPESFRSKGSQGTASKKGASSRRRPLPDQGGVTPTGSGRRTPTGSGRTPPPASGRGPLPDQGDEQEPKNKNPLTRTQVIPPLPPHPGGDGLTAVDGLEDRSDQDRSITEEQPTAGQLPALPSAAKQPAAEQPSAITPVKPKRPRPRRSAGGPTPEQAHRLMTVWNEHKPDGWGGLRCVNGKRWEVAMNFAGDLGGFEAFLNALPLALHNAAADRFWGGPGHDWNSFMGYGEDTGKGHFLRFLEQEAPRVPTTNPDGSLTFAGTVIQTRNNPTPQLF